MNGSKRHRDRDRERDRERERDPASEFTGDVSCLKARENFIKKHTPFFLHVRYGGAEENPCLAT